MLQRHNLYLYQPTDGDTMPSLDVGITVAVALQAQEATQISLDVSSLLAVQISSTATHNNKSLKVLRLKNIAILCEPMLGITAADFLLEQSKYFILLLEWDGAVSADKKTLYWANSSEIAFHFPIALEFFPIIGTKERLPPSFNINQI